MFTLFCLFCTSPLLFGQTPVQKLTSEKFTPTSKSISPFSLMKSQAKTGMVNNTVIEDFEILDLNTTSINQILTQKSNSLELTIPVSAQVDVDLELIPSEYKPSEFKTYAASNRDKYLKLPQGKHYWGRVKGDPNSMVALSIYDGEITGSINTSSSKYSLSKLKGQKEHILYQEKNLKEKPTFACYSDDIEQLAPATNKGNTSKAFDVNNAVRMYIEVDNDIFQDFGTVQATANYINAAMNQVAILYANEQINLLVNELVIWDTTDPYTGPSTGNYLNQFQDNLAGNFNGDLAHLIGNQGNGGVAYVNGICANKNYALGYSGIRNTFNNVPSYSWTINVLTHEIGHNLGSPHTHSCSWNGNNTAIDGCGPASGNSEGCDGPLPSEGGTIMSYCHLTNVGINFSLGFGQQPGDLIRSIVHNAPCLTPSANTCNDGIQNGNETGVDCGGSCAACPPSCTDGIKNGNETGIDCGGDCNPCPDVCANKTEININIRFDNYPEETSWELRNSDNTIIASGGTYANQADGSTITLSECLEDGCYSFVIKDSYGDGICCSYGQGNYTVTSGNETLASGAAFAQSESTDFCIGASTPTCNDGIQNGNETGIDCGGSDCQPCATCDDGIQNGDETGVDCGGTDCQPCSTCDDGIQNGNETGIDCGGSECSPCITCDDGIQNGTETGVDCGGECAPCVTCDDGIQNGDETGVDCGGSECSPCITCDDGIQNGTETGVDCGGECAPCITCNDGIQNGDETGVDCGGSDCAPCITCEDGIQNGVETGIDCGGPDCPTCPVVPTCDDGIQNGSETGIDCGGPDCAACETCDDGIQNGSETGVDCGGPDCADCETSTCTDVIISITFDNYPEETAWVLTDDSGTVIGQGGTYGNQPDGSTISVSGCLEDGCYTFTISDTYGDGICCTYGNGSYSISVDGAVVETGGSFSDSESRTFCLGDEVAPTCTDGIQNGDETGIDCGGSCEPCPTDGSCTYATILDNDFEVFSTDWIDGGSDCRRSIYDSNYASSGSYCYRLRDDSYTSNMRTQSLDLSAAEEIIIEFSYLARSMDNSSEGFILEISTDNGASYSTIADWYRGSDFANNQRMFESVVYSGSMTNQTVVRFRCDGSSNADYVYIDDVTITACNTNQSAVPASVDIDTPLTLDQVELSLYPNPADSEVTISFQLDMDRSAQLSFFDLSGRIVYEQEAQMYKAGNNSISVNTTQMREGMFYAVMTTAGSRLTKKFVIVRE